MASLDQCGNNMNKNTINPLPFKFTETQDAIRTAEDTSKRLKGAVNNISSAAASIAALRSINLPEGGNPIARQLSTGLAQGVIGGTFNNTTISNIPKASAMRFQAQQVESEAIIGRENEFYQKYLSVFDSVQAASRAGFYEITLPTSEQQYQELSTYLVKYGYKITQVTNTNSENSIKISW
jgi:hypothetical protein